jgi:hypothetical protein
MKRPALKVIETMKVKETRLGNSYAVKTDMKTEVKETQRTSHPRNKTAKDDC